MHGVFLPSCNLPNLLVGGHNVVEAAWDFRDRPPTVQEVWGCCPRPRPLGEESDISPEVDDVMVVVVVVVVLREDEALWWLLLVSPCSPRALRLPLTPLSPSESESDESPVNGTDLIWLALCNEGKNAWCHSLFLSWATLLCTYM